MTGPDSYRIVLQIPEMTTYEDKLWSHSQIIHTFEVYDLRGPACSRRPLCLSVCPRIPAFYQRRASVYDAGPALIQRWADACV